MIPIMVSLSMN